MSRPLRIEFPGAVYHVTSRGNAGRRVFSDADDGARFMGLLEREIVQQRWLCHAFCLMPDHYHLLLETPEPNLGRGMARLNMSYSQWSNRRHHLPGHLFQGRYRAILVEKGDALMALVRHVVLNPRRSGLVNHAGLWRWSSYHALAVAGGGPDWVFGDWILDRLGGVAGGARENYRRFVDDGLDAPSPWRDLRGGLYLGGEDFLTDMAGRVRDLPLTQVSAAMARPDRPTPRQVQIAVADAARVPAEAVFDRRGAREPYRVAAFLLRRACNLPLRQVADMTGVSPGRISQIQRAIEDAGGLGTAFPWAAPLERLYKG